MARTADAKSRGGAIQVLVGEDRKEKLIREAIRQDLSMAQLIRRWIDAGCPTN